MHNAYYRTYSEFAEMVSLLSNIPGIKVQGG